VTDKRASLTAVWGFPVSTHLSLPSMGTVTLQPGSADSTQLYKASHFSRPEFQNSPETCGIPLQPCLLLAGPGLCPRPGSTLARLRSHPTKDREWPGLAWL
jgi:hypothetical protein